MIGDHSSDKKGQIRETIREGYGKIARTGGSCCSSSCCGSGAPEQVAQGVGYSEADLALLPEGANLGLSCGNPTALASLKPGEVVLDLGSGDGFDVFVAGLPEGTKAGDYVTSLEVTATKGQGPAPGADGQSRRVYTPAVGELVAIGAAIAANCRPCFKYHRAQARKARRLAAGHGLCRNHGSEGERSTRPGNAPVVSTPIAVCLFFMMYPIMVKIDVAKVLRAGRSIKPVGLTLLIFGLGYLLAKLLKLSYQDASTRRHPA